jgi:hypothetical protein
MWRTATDRSAALLAQSVGRESYVGGQYVTVESLDHALTLLEQGTALSTGDLTQIRYQPVPTPPRVEARPRFTCRRCGENRDTTLQGHCDDCE